LVDWAKSNRIKTNSDYFHINDTIATNTWIDSYPYAAISAFALHPFIFNLYKSSRQEYADKVSSLKRNKTTE
jgi:4-alpha-glucanotransferase